MSLVVCGRSVLRLHAAVQGSVDLVVFWHRGTRTLDAAVVRITRAFRLALFYVFPAVPERRGVSWSVLCPPYVLMERYQWV